MTCRSSPQNAHGSCREGWWFAHERHIGSSLSACTHGRSRLQITHTRVGPTHVGAPFCTQAVQTGVSVFARRQGRWRPQFEQTATGSS
ncbi:MAG: hypothetical protein ACLP01_07740 [Solirubrobacteraceae bacterium]